MTVPTDELWLRRYLAPLAGATIRYVTVEVDDQVMGMGTELWPTLYVTTAAGEQLELTVSQDEEGNGPGFIFGLPFPQETPPPVPVSWIREGVQDD